MTPLPLWHRVLRFAGPGLVLLLALLGAPRVAFIATADATESEDGCLREPECRDHYQRAIALYESGRYEAALPEFEAAYQSRQMPWLLINIGRTLHRLGRLDEAITLYNRYEQATPNGDPETARKVREYKAQAQVLLVAKGGTSSSGSSSSDKSAGPVPLYKKWWFWTAVGGGVAVLAAGIAIGVAAGHHNGLPSDVPTYKPTF